MKKLNPVSIIIILLFNCADIFAQNIPADKYRATMSKEVVLHDTPYRMMKMIHSIDWTKLEALVKK